MGFEQCMDILLQIVTGGFEEDAELEIIIEGEHTMFIYDDIEYDYVADQNGNSAKIIIHVPCS